MVHACLVSAARNITFVDLDLDNAELGGDILWEPGCDWQFQDLNYYDVYLAENEEGARHSFVGQGGHRSIRSIDRPIQSIDSIDSIMLRLFENF